FVPFLLRESDEFLHGAGTLVTRPACASSYLVAVSVRSVVEQNLACVRLPVPLLINCRAFDSIRIRPARVPAGDGPRRTENDGSRAIRTDARTGLPDLRAVVVDTRLAPR